MPKPIATPSCIASRWWLLSCVMLQHADEFVGAGRSPLRRLLGGRQRGLVDGQHGIGGHEELGETDGQHGAEQDAAH